MVWCTGLFKKWRPSNDSFCKFCFLSFKMSDNGWDNLPSVVLLHLYQYLSHNDRIQASSACQHWREAFWFYPNWRKLDLSAADWFTEKNSFLVEKYSKICKSLRVTFVLEDLKNVGGILRNWTAHPSFSDFQMVGTADKTSENGTWESIVYPFLEKFCSLRELVLSHVENTARLTTILDNNATTIKSLGIGLLIDRPEDTDRNTESVAITADFLSTLISLTILQLDSCWITADALTAIAKLPLKRFIATLHQDSTIHPISESSWHSFTQMRRSEIRVTYYKITNSELQESYRQFFRGTAAHVRFIYCSQKFQEACLNALLRERLNAHTITTIWAIMDPKMKDAFSREHAFVVCAWRFKHLRKLILSGSSYDKYDLEGMARMRPGLLLHIAKEDIWELNNGHRLLTPSELGGLAKVLIPNRGGEWFPMDEKRFNDPTLPFKDREVTVLRELYLDDFETEFQSP